MSSLPSVDAPPRISLREAVAEDDAFLRRLIQAARPELQLLPPELVDLQIAAQRTQYLRHHPGAVDEIVELDREPVGRCWTADAEGELQVLDLAVQVDRRRHGIGRAVLKAVAERAAARGAAVRLTVWSTNTDARRLYLAAGFTEVGQAGGHVVMRLVPGSYR